MEIRRSPEEFEPRIVAFFDKGQLRKIFEWGRRNNLNRKEAVDSALERVQYDEEGKLMDETSKIRLKYGVAAVDFLIGKRQNVNEVL